jgi:hypothetical protein
MKHVKKAESGKLAQIVDALQCFVLKVKWGALVLVLGVDGTNDSKVLLGEDIVLVRTNSLVLVENPEDFFTRKEWDETCAAYQKASHQAAIDAIAALQ